MKVKLMFESEAGKEVVVGMNALPCVGERLIVGAKQTGEVMQVIHTPTNGGHDAIVVLRTVEE